MKRFLRRSHQDLHQRLVRQGRATELLRIADSRGQLEAVFVGDYVLDQKIGSSHLGTLFLATHLPSGTVYAARRLNPDILVTVESYRQTAHSVADGKHEWVVAANEALGDGQGISVFRRYVSGESLRHLVVRAGALDPVTATTCIQRLCELFSDPADSVARISQLQPAQVICDSAGVITLVDVGESRVAAFTKRRERAGARGHATAHAHPGFTAPELLLGKSSSAESMLIYSLGCLFFYLTTGETPHPPVQAAAIAKNRATLHEKLSSCHLTSSACEAIWQCIVGMMEADPKRRYRRISEVKTTVQQLSALLPGAADWGIIDPPIGEDQLQNRQPISVIDTKKLAAVACAGVLLIATIGGGLYSAARQVTAPPPAKAQVNDPSDAQRGPTTISADEAFRIP